MKATRKPPVFRMLILAVTVCLTFTACAPSPDLTQVPYPTGNAFQNGEVFDTGDTVFFIVSVPDVYYFEGNPGNRHGNNVLFAYDKQTGEIEIFCKKRSCDHETLDCPAIGIEQLSFCEGKLYGRRRWVVNNKWHEAFVALTNGRARSILTSTGQAQYYQGDLYVVLSLISHNYILLRYPKNSPGQPEILKTDFFCPTYAYADDCFYYFDTDSRSIHRLHLDDPSRDETVVENASGVFATDGEYIYYCSDKRFMRCGLDGSDPITLAQTGTIWSVNFDETYFYYCISHPTNSAILHDIDIFRLKKDLSSEPELLANVDFSFSLYTTYQSDLLFLQSYDECYTMKKDGSDLQKLKLPVNPVY